MAAQARAMKRTIVFTVAFALVAWLTLHLSSHLTSPQEAPLEPVPGERPNLVLIMVDDLGWGDLGSYGQKLILTPELDAMARGGLRFTDFYSAAPHCQPARASLLTGLHTGHTQVRLDVPLRVDGPLISEVLHGAGYTTGMFGKWGMSQVGEDDLPVEADPAEMGFDAFVGQITHRDAHAYYLDSPPSPPGTPEHPYYPDIRQFLYQIRDGATLPLHLPPDRYVHDEIVDQTLAFIAENRYRPFFLYLPWTLPHAELAVPADSLAPYLDADGVSLFPEIPWTPPLDGAGFDRHNRMPRATYAGMVSRLSRDVGRLLEHLAALGLAQKTVVIFTSDNGPHDAGGIISPAFFNSAGGLSGMKWSLHEGGIREPMIVWSPWLVRTGVESQPAALWDLYPTLVELAGAPLPEPLDGMSLVPLFAAETPLPNRALYWETFISRADVRQAVRRGRYKALRPVGSDRLRLYDLVADPSESDDLSAEASFCPEYLALAELLNTSRVPPRDNPGGRFDISPVPLRCPVEGP